MSPSHDYAPNAFAQKGQQAVWPVRSRLRSLEESSDQHLSRAYSYLVTFSLLGPATRSKLLAVAPTVTGKTHQGQVVGG